MSQKLSEIETTRAMWEVCLKLLLAAINQLRPKLNLSETEFRRISHSASGKAQEIYFYRALDEIQKAGIALMHWKELFTDLEKNLEAEKQISRVILEETSDNQSLRCRKLIELLVELVLFESTNSISYFRDYLLIRELNEHADSQRDRNEFYGHENRNCAESMGFYFKLIQANEPNIDLPKRWYLKTPEPTKSSWMTKGAQLSSFKARYTKAIKLCDPAEFICLGKSYLHAYGVSREVHFSPQENSSSFSAENCLQLADRTILLANRSLIRLAHLMGATGEKSVQTLIETNQLNDGNLQFVRNVREEQHVVGDYVIVHSDLARVVEVKRSKHDFVAYQITYLDRAPMPHIKQDWFAAFEVRGFVSKTQAEAKVNDLLNSLPPEQAAVATSFREPKGWISRLDRAILEMWMAFKASKLRAHKPEPPRDSS